MYLIVVLGLVFVACNEKPQECTAKGMNDLTNKQIEVSDSINRLIERNNSLYDSYMELAELDAQYIDTLKILSIERKELLVNLENHSIKAQKEFKALDEKCAEFNK